MEGKWKREKGKKDAMARKRQRKAAESRDGQELGDGENSHDPGEEVSGKDDEAS